MRAVLITLLGLFAFGIAAANENWTKGIEAYKNLKFQEAITQWEGIEEDERSAELWYNLGNAYYKTDVYGKARWCYEKSLHLNPDLDDAAFNLELLKGKLIDVIEESPYSGIQSSYEAAIISIGEKNWLLIAVLCGLLGALGWLMYFLAKTISIRKSGFTLGLISSILCLITYLGAKEFYEITEKSPFGIVISKKVDVFHAPDETTSKAFILHEGIKVEVVKIVGNWQEIKISNGQSGWIEGKHLIAL